MWVHKVFGKETQKKLLEKTSWQMKKLKNKIRIPKTWFSLIFHNFETNKDREFEAQKLAKNSIEVGKN